MFPRVLGKKKTLFYGLLTVVLVISAVYLLLPPELKLSYVLDDAHLSEVKPNGTWGNMTCPQCESQMEQIVIIQEEEQCCDCPWRYAYYCRREDIFWVADCPGYYFAGWYGPFDAHWRLANTVAAYLFIFSGITLVLLAIRDKGLMKKHQLQRQARALIEEFVGDILLCGVYLQTWENLCDFKSVFVVG